MERWNLIPAVDASLEANDASCMSSECVLFEVTRLHDNEWDNDRMTFPPENEIMNKKQMSFTNMSEEQCLNKKKSFKLRK